jgi:hypothetical protein
METWQAALKRSPINDFISHVALSAFSSVLLWSADPRNRVAAPLTKPTEY